MNGNIDRPVIPETITVHLGAPDQAAENVTIPFAEYIKNVASSEIYPTWPEAAIRANILAQISFALNRIYTEHYPARDMFRYYKQHPIRPELRPQPGYIRKHLPDRG